VTLLVLQLPMKRRPVGLDAAAVPLLGADGGKKLRFQRGVRRLGRAMASRPGGSEPLQRQPNRRRRHNPPGGTILVAGYTGGIQPKTSRTWRIAISLLASSPPDGKSQRNVR